MFNIFSQTIQMPDGQIITLETGKLARQTDGSVVLKSGNLVMLATVCANKEHKEGTDFLPLSVDYQEKFASAGKIPGSFQRREGKLSDNEVLISRLIDRALRPIFPENFHAEVQVMVTLHSADANIQPDALAALAASAAIMVSDIPFNGPISEVRVCKINGEYRVNPPVSEIEKADLDLIVAGTIDSILMVEGEGNEISETEMVEAMKVAHEAIKLQVSAQKELEAKVGNTTKREYCHETHDDELKKKMYNELFDKVYLVCTNGGGKNDRSTGFANILKEFKESLPEEERSNPLHKVYFGDITYDASRKMVLDEGKRLDGRKLDEIRPIVCEVDYLPSAHGSALFTRGETQREKLDQIEVLVEEKLAMAIWLRDL
jgi:polyribonucleotide nucleotidyltransferase